jgi:hypothetical protein
MYFGEAQDELAHSNTQSHGAKGYTMTETTKKPSSSALQSIGHAVALRLAKDGFTISAHYADSAGEGPAETTKSVHRERSLYTKYEGPPRLCLYMAFKVPSINSTSVWHLDFPSLSIRGYVHRCH